MYLFGLKETSGYRKVENQRMIRKKQAKVTKPEAGIPVLSDKIDFTEKKHY